MRMFSLPSVLLLSPLAAPMKRKLSLCSDLGQTPFLPCPALVFGPFGVLGLPCSTLERSSLNPTLSALARQPGL